MFKAFLRNESGTETVEWAIMAGLFVAAVIIAVNNVAVWVGQRFEDLEANTVNGGQ